MRSNMVLDQVGTGGILLGKVENLSNSCRYLGMSQDGAALTSDTSWRIARETYDVATGISTIEFANDGKFISIWNDRATYFGVAPAAVGPGEDVVASAYLVGPSGVPVTTSSPGGGKTTLDMSLPTGAATAALQTPVYATPNSLQTITSLGTAAVSAVIAAANAARRAFYVWNNGANSAYLNFAAVASASTPVQIISTFTAFVSNGPVCYTGILSAIRNTGTGNMVVLEVY